MGDRSKIEWTDATWGPVTGCTRVSAGCDHCLHPDTRVLRTDGTWARIADISVGDQLLGCTENAGAGVNRTLQVATVEAATRTRDKVVTITTASGRTVKCSPNHRFLSGVGRPTWVMAQNLRLGAQLFGMGDPRTAADTSDLDYREGYIAGVTDGDGTYRYNPERRRGREPGHQVYWRVAVLADDQPILDRLVQYLAEIGVPLMVQRHPVAQGRAPMVKVETRRAVNLAAIGDLLEPRDSLAWKAGWLAGFLDTDGSSDGKSHRWSQKKPNGHLDRTVQYLSDLGFSATSESSGTSVRLTVTGLSERVAVISALSPALHRKALGKQIGTMYRRDPDRVVSLSVGEDADLIDIQTSTGTFIAEGLTTHNCYIDRSPPFRMNGRRFDKPGPGGTTGVLLHPDRLDQPLRWRRPRKVFVNSLSDLFHDEVPNEYIARVFGVMGWAPRHTFQVLTKRPARMRALLADGGFRQEVLDLTVRYGAGYDRPTVDRGKPFDVWPLPNVWLGTSVEDQKAADLRIPKLLDTPAAVRFLSCEPLLGPVDLRRWTVHEPACAGSDEPPWCTCPPSPDLADPYFYKDRIDWVIAGGESGPGARPMHPDWPRGLRDQCAAAGVAFHFKQWGEYVTVGQMTPDTYAEWDLKHGGEVWPKDTQWRVGKHKAGRLLDGRTHDEYPEAIA